MAAPTRLPRKPEARTERVEDIVARALRGEVRVPRFQRPLRWGSKEVRELFDSVYRGYPIGALLFYRRAAPAARVAIGPLTVDAEESTEAWWVVDGQQRVTALTACLARPTPLPDRPDGKDPHVLFFDAQKQTFEGPPPRGAIPGTWVPLPVLLDGSRLSEWIFGWQHHGDETLRKSVFEAGSRIREYGIPLYLIDTEDEKVAEEIFYRTNTAGKALEWNEVHAALFGAADEHPSTLGELADELSSIGMGRLSEDRLRTCLIAMRGKDPTQSLGEHIDRDRDALRHAVADLLPVLRRVLSFLRADAGIPHLRLLPKSILLDVLTRFFEKHPNPSPRARLLLGRWFWRLVLGGGVYDDRTLRRRGIAAVSDNEEVSVQVLLSLVRRERPDEFQLPEVHDARADASRIAMLALAHLQPRRLGDGHPIDVAELLEVEDKEAFQKIVPSTRGLSRSPANRMIQPSRDLRLKEFLEQHSLSSTDPASVLASHAIPPQAARALSEGRQEELLSSRAEALVQEVRLFTRRRAAWEHSDRPSVDFILAEAGVELSSR